MTSRYLALATPLLLAGCLSTPTHYYTLQPTHSTVPAAAGSAAPFQFEMLSVRMPVQVDQPELVLRKSDGSLDVLDSERWSAPLADEFHDALTGQLERQLGTLNLAGLPKDGSRPLLSLQTDVRRFDSVPGQYARIDVAWSLSTRAPGEKRRNLTCSSQITQPAAAAGIEGLVLAHQQAIAQLAASIARTARGWASNPGTGCPSVVSR